MIKPIITGVGHIALISVGIYVAFVADIPQIATWQIWINAAFMGLLGGSTYCLRAVYITYCAENRWNDRWIVWYLIRPVVSCIMGVMALLFVKAGLLLLTMPEAEPSRHYGLYSLAFIAGYNVDNFLKKIENFVKNVAQIEKTNISKRSEKD